MWGVNGLQRYEAGYDANGNILHKSDVTRMENPPGAYNYGHNAGPHAVTSVTNPTDDYMAKATPQIIGYTAFNKVDNISQTIDLKDGASTFEMQFVYGPGNSRKRTKFFIDQTLYKTKYFIGGNYEIEKPQSGPDRKLHYISGGDGIFAIFVQEDSKNTMYYIHKDHLGSYYCVTSDNGIVIELNNVEQIYSFDPWGRRRNHTDWSYENIPISFLFDRGFTGHEHLDAFGLINMNGRVYDNSLGRFLSPDPYVQMPDFSQNFNRYSYCLNNPLVYVDPNGEIFGTIFTFFVDFFDKGFTEGGFEFWNWGQTNFNNAWANFDPTTTGTKTNTAWQIDKGLVKTDPNRTFFGQVFQFVSRFTWELPQTSLGNIISHGRNISGNVDNVDYYGGATLVNDNDRSYRGAWGFALGPYINSKNIVADPNLSEIFRHEYGHTLQSRLVGPLYLTHVALPSLIGQGLDNIGLSDHNREWYETQANRMAERYFRNHDPGALTALPWDDNEYPREYNPNWYWIFAHPPLPFMWWLFF